MQKAPIRIWQRAAAFVLGYVAAVIAFTLAEEILIHIAGAQSSDMEGAQLFVSVHRLAIARIGALATWVVVYLLLVRWMRRRGTSKLVGIADVPSSEGAPAKVPTGDAPRRPVLSRLDPIKRGVLLGAGTYLLGGAFWLMSQSYFEWSFEGEIFVGTHILAGIGAVYAGVRAGPGRSPLHTALGWLLGFAGVFVLYAAAVGITAVLDM
jgi:hypothetical protein